MRIRRDLLMAPRIARLLAWAALAVAMAGRSATAAPPNSASPPPDLSAAALEGDIRTVRRLFSQGADVNGTRGDGRPPLCMSLAAYVGEASTTSRPHPPSAAETRRYAGKLQIAWLLLQRGAAVAIADQWTLTPLHHAAAFNGTESKLIPLVQDLLRRGAPVDAKTGAGVTPLWLAVDRRRVRIARVLLQAGADPTIASAGGKSSIQLAKERGLGDLARDLEARPRFTGPCDAWMDKIVGQAERLGEQKWRERILALLGDAPCTSLPVDLRRALKLAKATTDAATHDRILLNAASAVLGPTCTVADLTSDARQIAHPCPLPERPELQLSDVLEDILAVDYLVLNAIVTSLIKGHEYDASAQRMAMDFALSASLRGERVREQKRRTKARR